MLSAVISYLTVGYVLAPAHGRRWWLVLLAWPVLLLWAGFNRRGGGRE